MDSLAKILMFVCLLFAIYLYNIKDHDPLIVKLNYPVGEIRGHILKSERGQDYYAFQDIPYAAPPVGSLRYQIPQRHPGWQGILNTTKNTKICPQPGHTHLPISEDCLNLNVYTPVVPGSNPDLAVYVWITGGAFMEWDGSFSRYNPSFLIDYDIIVVTINFRIGALGFLTTDDGVIPGNLGLRDQHLALQWVQENIHLFGGDPNKVTIGGESSGGTSVGLLMASSMSKGLFRGAILESGCGINTYSTMLHPKLYAFQLGRIIDESINTENSTQLLEILQKADVRDILAASLQVPPFKQMGTFIPDLVWAPIIETHSTTSPLLSEPIHEAYANGDFLQVPSLIGFNSEEILWLVPTSNTKHFFKLDNWEQFDEKSAYVDEDPSRLLNYKHNIDEVNKPLVYNKLRRIYTNSSFLKDRSAFLKYSADFVFTHGTIRQAELSSKYVPTYLYQFDYEADKHSEYPGAEHTEEMRYLWKNYDGRSYTNEFQPILQHRMCKLWTNFIKYLNPTPIADDDLEGIVWPSLKPDNIQYLNINENFQLLSNPRYYEEVRDVQLKYLGKPWYIY